MKLKIFPYLYVIPAVLFVSVFLLYPVGYTLYISFTEWDGIAAPKIIGLKNYAKFLSEPVFIASFKNTIIWVICILLLPVLLGLALAVMVNRIKFETIFKSVFYIPLALSSVGIGMMWTVMFGPKLGIINAIFRSVGLDSLTHSWLTEVPLNTFSMIFVATWQTTGFNMVMFLMGLRNVPIEPIEASKLDGASGWQSFVHIILPLLRPVTMIVIIINVMSTFKIFDIIYVMTHGGPYRSSETLAFTMYRESFLLFSMGYGSAIAILLCAFVLIISVIYIRTMIKREIRY